MSNTIFPQTNGLKIERTKTPQWKTITHVATSGKETRTAMMSYPRWVFSLSFEFLKDDLTAQFATFAGFFNNLKGSFDSFLYLDPYDNTVTNQTIGTGNGTTKDFQLIRNLGSFIEPIKATATKSVYVGGVLQYFYARTNLLKYTSQLDNSVWTKIRSTVTANATTDPFGGSNAEKHVIDTTSTTSHYIYQNTPASSILAGDKVTYSVYAKKGELNSIFLQFLTTGGAFSSSIGATFNIDTGVVSYYDSGVTAIIDSTVSGWYRVSIAATASNNGYTRCVNYLADTNATGTYSTTFATGDGTSGIYLYGSQCEISAMPTTYIDQTSTITAVTDATDTDGLITFANAPSVGDSIVWSGQFYFRCRFLNDDIELSQFMYDLWELKKVEFISIK